MDLLDPNVVASIFGEAAQSEFIRTCAIFSMAAFIHGRKVAKEVKEQGQSLVAVIREDLDLQRKLLGGLTDRVANIEVHLKIGGTDGTT